VLVIVNFKDDLAEREMVMVARCTRLVLNAIDHICHAGGGKN
jgi:hypothetical protein